MTDSCLYINTYEHFTSFSTVTAVRRARPPPPTDMSGPSSGSQEEKSSPGLLSARGCTKHQAHYVPSGLSEEARNATFKLTTSLLSTHLVLPPKTHAAAWIRTYSGIGVFLQFSDNILQYYSLMRTRKIINYMPLIHGDDLKDLKRLRL